MTMLQYKAYLRSFSWELELDNLRMLRARTEFIWGRYIGGFMWICCLLSIQWVRFLAFCARGGK
jgi:hypothetical protein